MDLEQDRRDESGRRRRMLDGTWGEDLKDYLLEVLNIKRAQNMGRCSTAINLAKSVADQVGPVLYQEAPSVEVESAEATEQEYLGLLERCHWATLSKKQSTYTWAIRECAWKVDVADTLKLRIVTPDALKVEADPDDPEAIYVVKHRRQRYDPMAQKNDWFWDVWDKVNETITIEDAAGNARNDLLPEGVVYHWPWVLCHAEPTGAVWDSWAMSELFDGAFDVAVLWNGYSHVMRDASWAQKYARNVRLVSPASVRDGTATVVTDPTSMLMFEDVSEKPGEIGVLAPPVDPAAYAEAVLTYQRTVVSVLGLHPADIETTTAQSGVAIALKRSAQRRMAEGQEPIRRASDLELFRVLATLSNQFFGTAYPLDGYRITYHHPADGVSERDAELEYHRKLVDAGLMSRSMFFRRVNPGATEQEAYQAIIDIAMENALLDSQVRAALAQIQAPPPKRDASDNPDDSPDETGGMNG